MRARGVVLKKKWGTPETRLRQRFLNNLGLHACCTEIILHCASVSNQLQQWTNFGTNFSPKKVGEWGTRLPCRKKWGRTPPPRPRPTTPLELVVCLSGVRISGDHEGLKHVCTLARRAGTNTKHLLHLTVLLILQPSVVRIPHFLSC